MTTDTTRQRNREDGIPDMQVGDGHHPAHYCAQVGWRWLLAHIGGPSEPADDWSQEGGDDGDRAQYLAARRMDHQRVADWLRAARVRAITDRDGCHIGDVTITWPDRAPQLAVWAGQQTLARLVAQRQRAMPENVTDVMAIEAPIKGASGIGPGASTALEVGFSIDDNDMMRVTAVAVELLAIIGAETMPITLMPDGRIAYDTSDGARFAFRVERRGQSYYRRWGMAHRLAGTRVDDRPGGARQ